MPWCCAVRLYCRVHFKNCSLEFACWFHFVFLFVVPLLQCMRRKWGREGKRLIFITDYVEKSCFKLFLFNFFLVIHLIKMVCLRILIRLWMGSWQIFIVWVLKATHRASGGKRRELGLSCWKAGPPTHSAERISLHSSGRSLKGRVRVVVMYVCV